MKQLEGQRQWNEPLCKRACTTFHYIRECPDQNKLCSIESPMFLLCFDMDTLILFSDITLKYVTCKSFHNPLIIYSRRNKAVTRFIFTTNGFNPFIIFHI
jgi:hypothetical protein